ncbi:MAG: ribosomal-protein-alanine acetyltransferase [Deferribacteraceae bacterium]|nr:ribosomal-protein-alanine acetyltransferase [Deferribacteraceae bacterium]
MIRVATLTDLEEIVKIENENYDTPWSYESFLNELYSDKSTIYVYELEGEITGYVVLYILIDEIDIANISVKKEYQGCKIGSRLMEFVLNKYIGYMFYLEVREDNMKAIALYEKFGFKSYSMRKDYYGRGINAILMKLNNLGVNYA